MHILIITQDEEDSVTLMTSDNTTDAKALELCRAAATIYAAEVRDGKGGTVEASGGVRDGLT